MDARPGSPGLGQYKSDHRPTWLFQQPTEVNMPLTIQTVQFVSRSEVFEGCDAAWSFYSDEDPPHSWGDNTRSMVTRLDISSVLGSDRADDEDDEDFDDDEMDDTDFEDEVVDEEQLRLQIATVKERLAGLPEGVLIDLEN